MGDDIQTLIDKSSTKTITNTIGKKPTQEELLAKAKNFDICSPQHKSIFLFGAAKTGKTWCYMPIIDEVISQGGHVHLISTDAGFVETFRAYFKERTQEVSKHITPYMISELEQLYSVTKEIRSNVFSSKSRNLIVIDLISSFYEMSQAKFIDDSSGGDFVNFIIRASHDNSKFGMFEGKMWQYIKKMDEYIRQQLIIPPICDVIAIGTEKDIDVEKKITKKVAHIYDVTGAKPGGAKELPYDFNTFIYVNKASGKRFFQVLGHRGVDLDPYERHEFERDFWSKFKEVIGENNATK